MPPGIADRWDSELIAPLAFKPKQLSDHDFRNWAVTGRLKTGVSIKQAQAEMDVIAAKERGTIPTATRAGV
jgi:putative ABC transport system permease protein